MLYILSYKERRILLFPAGIIPGLGFRFIVAGQDLGELK
jgi:hypothetical protein